MKTLIALIFLAAAGPALAQFKCTQPDGTVSFQQQPCAASAKSQRLELPPSAPDDGRAYFRAAVARGKIVVGMNRQELDQVSLGPPDKCNTTVTPGSVNEQCIYRGADRTLYVYLRDDVVQSIQQFPR